ncbi:serine endoprotease DegQ [Candidatus Pantoea edessiphila]|uniref:Serine endoprotease DegQ n=2 Tax=Candidatus Pantoea edessiphila TaxID=2044610 RepID=A0A2P5SYE3_9GAMM|nr:serine endoprotease DegQ [Candidatus Pantoea edessiphila]
MDFYQRFHGFIRQNPFDSHDLFNNPDPFDHLDQFGHPDPFDHLDQFGHPDPFGHLDPFGHPDPFGHLDPFGHPDPFSHLDTFGRQDSFDIDDIPKKFKGLGSGIIINANKGYILTNYHVINGAKNIYVRLTDHSEYDATLIGYDQNSDIALIKIDGAKKLTQVKISNSNIQVGDFVIAIGNPFGLGQTATSGIISAVGRSGFNVEGIESFIQTDASINKGSSGGALINLNGELIGINTAILSSNGSNMGIGFAIPSDIAINFAQQLIKYGKINRSMLGVKGTEITIDMAKTLNLHDHHGVFITEVMPDSAAQKAGIKSGDIITLINQKPINNFNELHVKIGLLAPGENIKLVVIRNGKILSLNVNLKKNALKTLCKKSIFTILPGAALKNGRTKSGQKGIIVTDVEENTTADKLGLRKNDVIISINRKRTNIIDDMAKILKSNPSMLAINIIRDNENIYLLLR